MLGVITRFCTKEPWLVILLTVATCFAGWLSYRSIAIDAIPDIGENQVIVLTPWPGRSPKDIEDQITYPLSASLLSVPGAKSVRGKSMFGYSFVQVTFRDSVDFYWARSRVSEQLITARSELPAGVSPQLGPDATGLGQVFYYTLQPSSDGTDLAELRSIQDFVVKYELQSVDGVSEVASIGGYVRQYQIEVDPDRLRYHRVTLDALVKAVRGSNLDVGAKTVESTGMEFIVRGKGFLGSEGERFDAIQDIERIVIRQTNGVPIRVSDVAKIQIGPEFRRGALDYNGTEAVGGVVVMRYGENPRSVIQRVREKIRRIEPALGGVTIHPVYDRSGLIDETVSTLTNALRDEILITAVVILLFLLHMRSSFIVAISLPVAVLISFIAMRFANIDANIMSLAGIAIAIGTMVDMAIIVAENIYGHLAEAQKSQTEPSRVQADSHSGSHTDHLEIVRRAVLEVAPAVSTAVTTTIVSFLPVFFLTGRDYRLFAPLAYTKTFAIAAALVVSVTLVPALSRLLIRSFRLPKPTALIAGSAVGILGSSLMFFFWAGRIATPYSWAFWIVVLAVFPIGFLAGWQLVRERVRPLAEIPSSRLIRWVYGARLRFALQHKAIALVVPTALVVLGIGAWRGLPTVLQPVERLATSFGADVNALPGYVQAKHVLPGLRSDDWIALDEGSWFYMPQFYQAISFSQALQLLQIQNVRIKEIYEVQDVLGKIGRVDSALDPAPAAMVETYVMLKPKDQWRPGVTSESIWQDINRVAWVPGIPPVVDDLQPIEGRQVMLQSGIKASKAVRIYGDDLKELASACIRVSDQLQTLPMVVPGSVAPDIVLGKPYVEFSVDRDTASRFGMNASMVNQVIETALGGLNLTKTVEGRERYPVRLRYERSLRENVQELQRIPVVTHSGAVVPLEELATLSTSWGPGTINSENGRLVAHVAFSTIEGVGDLEAVARIEKALERAMRLPNEDDSALNLPPGYSLEIVGSFRNQVEANRRLMWIIPLVIFINLLVIYLQFRNIAISLAVFTGIPVAFAGGMLLVGWMDIELNTAVWVGFIALFGLAVDDGVVMATYIHQKTKGRVFGSIDEIRNAIFQAGQKRIRPCVMTTATTLAALLPIILSTGRGADVARAMAIPVFGGMLAEPFTSFIVPTLYSLYLETKLKLGLQ